MWNFDNLIIEDKEFEIPINYEPREEGSPQIIDYFDTNALVASIMKLEFCLHYFLCITL